MNNNNEHFFLNFCSNGHRLEQKMVSKLLKNSGIIINGSELWDIQVYDPNFYSIVINKGSLGLGEAYMAGYWGADSPDMTLCRLLTADQENSFYSFMRIILCKLKNLLFNGQSLRRSIRDIACHYDLGNNLFEAMLDKRMVYSCAYWQDVENLDEAQEKKLDLICRKLKLESGQSVLDIGCGWGSLAAFAAENYGVKVTGVTLSAEQAKAAEKRCGHLPVDICLQDYRSITGRFDRVVSVGMIEHVGYKNYPVYMNTVHRVLKDDGLFLLHGIGSNISVTRTDPWIDRYIFPNGMVPSMQQLTRATEGLFLMEDWHSFGNYYDQTLMEWRKRFKQAWPGLNKNYSETFYRMWDYYLCCSAASFRAKKNQLWQIVFSKLGSLQNYVPVR